MQRRARPTTSGLIDLVIAAGLIAVVALYVAAYVFVFRWSTLVGWIALTAHLAVMAAVPGWLASARRREQRSTAGRDASPVRLVASFDGSR